MHDADLSAAASDTLPASSGWIRRTMICVVVFAIVGSVIGYFTWRTQVSRGAIAAGNYFIDQVLMGRIGEAVLISIYPQLREGVTPTQALLRQPRAVKGISQSPVVDFALGKRAQTEVTIVGVESIENRMQTNATGSKMDSVLRVIVRYRLKLGDLSKNFRLILHGFGKTGFASYDWQVFDTAEVVDKL